MAPVQSKYIERIKSQEKFATALSVDSTGSFPQSDESVSIQDRTEALIRGLILVLSHHSASEAVISSFEETFRVYLNAEAAEEGWLKRAKHALAYPLAWYLRNDLPINDGFPIYRPSGPFGGWMKHRRAFNRKNTHLWYSWFQAKRSSLPVSDQFVSNVYKKHFETLTKPDPAHNELLYPKAKRIFRHWSFQRVLKYVRVEFEKELSKMPKFWEFTPSSNASFHNSRANGGQRGEVLFLSRHLETMAIDKSQGMSWRFRDACKAEALHYLGGDYGQKLLQYGDKHSNVDAQIITYSEFNKKTRTYGPLIFDSGNVSGSELYGLYWSPYYNGISNYSIEIRMPVHGMESWAMLPTVARTVPCAERPSDDNSLEDEERYNACTIQAVLEPFKVRVISKGPGIQYYMCKPIQKALHNVLRRMSCFRLIGRTFCPTDLIDIVKNTDLINNEFSWFSVDFSAATDGLSSEFGLKIMEFLMKNQSPRLQSTALKVLGPHILCYPVKEADGKTVIEERGLQTNGQLMGSILSFPILCLGNLATYLYSQEEWSKVPLLDEFARPKYCPENDDLLNQKLDSVLVNGDDMVFLGPKNQWNNHVQNCRSIGLEMSVGKAYVHPVYSNVNSVSCHYDPYKCKFQGRGSSTPYRIDFLNAGLLLNRHKVQVKVRNDVYPHCPLTVEQEYRLGFNSLYFSKSGFTECIEEIMRGALPGAKKDLFNDILGLHSEEIRHETLGVCRLDQGPTRNRRNRLFRRNLFIPQVFGGIGLSPIPGVRTYFSSTQKRIAQTILNSYQRLRVVPVPAYSPSQYLRKYEEVDSIKSCPWYEPPKSSSPVPTFNQRKCGRSRVPDLTTSYVLYLRRMIFPMETEDVLIKDSRTSTTPFRRIGFACNFVGPLCL